MGNKLTLEGLSKMLEVDMVGVTFTLTANDVRVLSLLAEPHHLLQYSNSPSLVVA
jgi:hypothetical protein